MNSVLDRLLGYLEPARALVEFPLRFVLNLLDFHLPAWGYLVYDLGVVIFFYFVLRSLIQRFRLALPRGGQPLPEYDARGLAPEPDDEDGDRKISPRNLESMIPSLKKNKDWPRLAEAYVQLNRFKEAAKAYRKAGEMRRSAEFWNKAGKPLKAAQVLFKAGHYDAAGQVYLKEGKYNPAANAFLKCDRLAMAAQARAKVGKIGPALTLYIDYFKNNSESIEYRTEAAQSCYALLQENQDRIKLAPEDRSHLLANMAQVFESGKQHEQAAALYQAAGKPAQAGEIYLRAGKLKEAFECYKAAGDPKEAARIGGRYYSQIGRWNEAGLTYTSADEHQLAGDCFSKAKKPLEAAVAYAKAGNWPKSGLAYAHAERFEDAINALQKVPEDHPEFDATRALLGRCFYEQGDHAHCAATLDNHLTSKRVDANNVEYFYLLGLALEQLGKLSESRDILYKIGAVRREFRDVSQRLSSIESRISMMGSSSGQAGASVGATWSGGADAKVMEMGAATLGDRYELERELGRGGMGVVYLARDKQLDRPVALKFLGTLLNDSAEMGERFIREARVAAKISHPNIVSIYDIGASEGKAYIAMEYIEGQDLRGRLTRIGKFPPREAANIMIQICGALGVIHGAGIVHRDVKPENITLAKGGLVKLMDFGLARGRDNRLTQSGVVIGTPCYMAPEQALDQDVDGRADLYAMGLVFHEMLTGRIVFEDGDIFARQIKEIPPKPSEGAEGIPSELDAFTMKCVEKDPASRYQTAEELIEALRALDVGAS